MLLLSVRAGKSLQTCGRELAAEKEKHMTLQELRVDFILRRKGCLSLPITGCIVWSLAAIASFLVPPARANVALIISYFLLIPISIAIARIRGEQMIGSENPLFKLASMSRLMVSLLWAVHLPLFFWAPEFFPLSMAIGFAIHWIVFSWTVDHPVGLIHAILRTFLVLGGWYFFPENRGGAVSIAVAVAYLLSVWQLRGMYREMNSNALAQVS
jgi:hypothetical protein